MVMNKTRGPCPWSADMTVGLGNKQEGNKCINYNFLKMDREAWGKARTGEQDAGGYDSLGLL